MAGAPTGLAEAIREVLRDALRRFTASVSANQHACPTLSGPVRPGPKPPVVPWPLLAPSELDRFVKLIPAPRGFGIVHATAHGVPGFGEAWGGAPETDFGADP